jgi:hypothetical protein
MWHKLWWVGFLGLLNAILTLGMPGDPSIGDPDSPFEPTTSSQEQEGGGFIDPDGLTSGGATDPDGQDKGGNTDPDG